MLFATQTRKLQLNSNVAVSQNKWLRHLTKSWMNHKLKKNKCTGPERAAVGESYLSVSPHRLVSFTSPRGLRASDEKFHLDLRNGHLRTETLPSNAARVRMCIGRGRLEIPTSPPCASRGPVALPVVAVIERSLIKVRPVCLLWLVPSND